MPWIRWLEPFIFLIATPLSLLESPLIMTGFGFFTVVVILLFVDRMLVRHPGPKLIALGLYLTSILAISGILNCTATEDILGLLFFMGTFFAFLFLIFQEKLVVYVSQKKETVSLGSRGVTPKEAQYLLLLHDGKTSKAMAVDLGVNESTIRNALSRSYRKLGVQDKAEFMKWAGEKEIQP